MQSGCRRTAATTHQHTSTTATATLTRACISAPTISGSTHARRWLKRRHSREGGSPANEALVQEPLDPRLRGDDKPMQSGCRSAAATTHQHSSTTATATLTRACISDPTISGSTHARRLLKRRHSREGGNPANEALVQEPLDPRLRGDDKPMQPRRSPHTCSTHSPPQRLRWHTTWDDKLDAARTRALTRPPPPRSRVRSPDCRLSAHACPWLDGRHSREGGNPANEAPVQNPLDPRLRGDDKPMQPRRSPHTCSTHSPPQRLRWHTTWDDKLDAARTRALTRPPPQRSRVPMT
ncbi:hypothetical protein EDC25_103178 [Pseudofulvimonas gallinarii]|uniref:Uncharacterized protein n=1 Tax=Pseudofulvimonas gallinarii TaxID=634155 RepID=A0A4R3LJF4_9GAMM|nr:hypothetical protein EDC25_103178 [Pseudofulvimonas gallinarii]